MSVVSLNQNHIVFLFSANFLKFFGPTQQALHISQPNVMRIFFSRWIFAWWKLVHKEMNSWVERRVEFLLNLGKISVTSASNTSWGSSTGVCWLWRRNQMTCSCLSVMMGKEQQTFSQTQRVFFFFFPLWLDTVITQRAWRLSHHRRRPTGRVITTQTYKTVRQFWMLFQTADRIGTGFLLVSIQSMFLKLAFVEKLF